jgi:peptidoglycan-associated lipoprotein
MSAGLPSAAAVPPGACPAAATTLVQELPMTHLQPSTRRAAWRLGLPAMAALLAACAAPSPERGDKAAAGPERAVVTASANAGGAAASGSGASAGTAAQSQVSTVDLASRSGAAGASGGGSPSAAVAGAAALLAAPTERVVYFDFDSFAIRDEAKPVLEGHARVLVREGSRRLMVEGHTDERGGREYNLALGQKRAEAVARTLVLLGVAERQLEAVSYGEERPAASGSNEQAWARNRRAELKDN